MERNSKVIIVVSCLAIFIGGWVLLTAPGRVADKALAQAKQQLDQQGIAFEQFKAEFAGSANWYVPEYSSQVASLVATSQNQFDQAADSIKQAEKASGSKEKRAQSKAAVAATQAALAALDQARRTLADFEKIITDSRILLAQVQQTFSEIKTTHESAGQRLANEGGQYLSKYVSLETERLAKVDASLAQATGDIEEVTRILPEADSSAGLGDPQKALGQLKAMAENLALAKATAQQVAGDLEVYHQAQLNAPVTVRNSGNKIAAAAKHLDGLVSQSSLRPVGALKAAFGNVDEAKRLLQTAALALETLVEENKYDYPLAYTTALKSSALADGAIQEANRQLALFNQATEGIKGLRLAISKTQGSIGGSQVHLAKLDYHTRSTWSQVADNISKAEINLGRVQESLVKAESLVLTDQAFEAALREIQDGRDFLDRAESLVATLIQVANNLESYRADWPNVERRAKNAIDNEESNISSYGSYSDSAKSDFDSAESSLRSAQAAARSNDYQTAVEKANSASQLAFGTGDKAYQAYRNHQNRQSLSNSGSNSSDSSSSWGGSSNSSDGGSWGGGSSGGSDGGDW